MFLIPAEIESDEVECENGVKTTAEKNRKTSLKLSLSEEIDEKWITEHARQVHGGVLLIASDHILTKRNIYPQITEALVSRIIG